MDFTFISFKLDSCWLGLEDITGRITESVRTLGMQNQGFEAKMDMDDERCPSKGEPTTPVNPQVFERQEFYDYSWDDSIRSHIYGGGLYWL
ncbi:hypothetical protein CDAR_121571 [Caerostris darwini]|uniref:Uncharacterized protein n=1 Tax=Caerostris darwini TaxID=1538125 RepID=A0AAV4V8P2_9ARAC|nr:hypothetical protein CDAR_121571 [Caerostris darwini]